MPKGTVKWFNNAKGFGFILPEEGGSDLFAHYSSIEMDGYRTLKAGQQVEFEVEDGDKGLHAIHIRPTDSKVNSDSSTPQDDSRDQSDNEAREEAVLEEAY